MTINYSTTKGKNDKNVPDINHFILSWRIIYPQYKRLISCTKKLFDLPYEVKKSYSRTAEVTQGYVGINAERQGLNMLCIDFLLNSICSG